MRLPLLFLFLLCFKALISQETRVLRYQAQRTPTPPKIDGIINEACWKEAGALGSFRQYQPDYGQAASFATEVRILYTDLALYIAARMHDPHPDSILRQLGNRDEDNLNADYFAVEFDTYNNQLDAYLFLVTASGVQADNKQSDDAFDAAWESAVRPDSAGWTAELRIPYSALRFPATSSQSWRLQLSRSIRRYRETSQWALETKGSPNNIVYWGVLDGLDNIQAGKRISLSPYFSASYQNYPLGSEGKKQDAYSFGGGLDLKYGFDESFTLDMSLLPDFSQVQSDDQVKNLTAFETIYEEQRPFFTEATDLFEKGDLFYSRRIGRVPLGYYSVYQQLAPGERVQKNPAAARLLNATKVSGRNKNGLAMGFLNAITANTYALLEDSAGNTREYLTDPRTNYSILVFDQALKNNSSLYLINTNTLRESAYRDANVTGSGLEWYNKSNRFTIAASGAISQLYDTVGSQPGASLATVGYKYSLQAGKVKGNWQMKAYYQAMDDKFSANDLGVTKHNNVSSYGLNTTFYQFEPKYGLREGMARFSFSNELNFVTGKSSQQGFQFNAYFTTMKYLWIWMEGWLETVEGYDYYEPRVEGRYFIKPRWEGGDLSFSSDYRKPFALDGRLGYYQAGRDKTQALNARLMPLVRLNNHLFFTYSITNNYTRNELGFAYLEGQQPVFGRRDINELMNTFSGRYMFSNKLSLNLKVRHYWSTGKYAAYYFLGENGRPGPASGEPENHDFNFNAFNIDLVMWWEFAPGSRLNLIWKNAITREDQQIISGFWKNFRHTWDSPQENTLTIKFLYYIDYQHIIRKHETSNLHRSGT